MRNSMGPAWNGFSIYLAGANRLDCLAIQPNFCKQKEPGALPAVRAGRGYQILKAALVEWLAGEKAS